jgi:hypothetical protein
VVHATRPHKNCPDCSARIDTNRRRCEPCAYAVRLASNLARYHANKAGRSRTKQCERCGQGYEPPRIGPSRYCGDTCRREVQLENKRRYNATNPRQAAPDFRPCKSCGDPVPRSGKVYATFCSDGCKPRCEAPGCSRPYKYRSGAGLLCPRDYFRWTANGSFLTKWEWESDPGNCRQCGKSMSRPVPMMGWICSTRCHGRRRLKIDESEKWSCLQCSEDIGRRDFRSDARLCLKCRHSRRPALSAHLIAKRDGVACRLCGHDVDMTLSGMDYWGPTSDHIVAVSRGGHDIPINLQLAHRICNIRKSDIVRV